MRHTARTALAVAAFSVLPQLAFAHTGVGATHGFDAGFAHPMGGLDHLLAMVTVGIFAYQLGGRAIWAVPVTFIALMAVGGALGISGIDVPFVELGIGLSVVVLGAAVALGVKAPLAMAMGLVGFFAIFHGHAHGAEMPEDASGLAYGVGFMFATALLHVAGLGLGMAIGRFGETHGTRYVRGAGAAVALAGIGLVTGIL
ncbi:HupE/UreJ family protein [Xanthobacter autotrophicus]|jgi:urease accessory protein|uniref:HupE/UreJ family protein n=1 Tax=Xanthobacter autotrophicus TaxID=280 RepID=A0A6C1KFT7_XANAU|nr:HupE/UreJ family protein [Xanthobacter autotrophicus]TLX42074.1 HupE/UreJ family protein [Xanthobacter autotrophicus]